MWGHVKAIKSGDFLEVWRFPGEWHQPRKKRRGKRYPRRSENWVLHPDGVYRLGPKKKRSDNIRVKKRNFERLTRAQMGCGVPLFLTLTFTHDISLKEGWREYSKFCMRFRYHNPGVVLITVPEWQKRGVLHFHALVWGLDQTRGCVRSQVKYRDKKGNLKRKHVCAADRNCERQTRKIAVLWGHGFVELCETDSSPALVFYMSKYLAKALNDERLDGQKSYTASRGVTRPEYFNNQCRPWLRDVVGWDVEVDNYAGVVHVGAYNTRYMGRCDYKVVDLKKI